MTKLVALLSFTVGIGALAACGGGDKEPLTPDNVDTSAPSTEAPATDSPATDEDAAPSSDSESAPSN